MSDRTKKVDGRKSPENVARLKAQGFQKGRQKTGGREALAPDVKSALQERTLDAIAVLEDVMINSSNDNARVKAALWFIEPFLPHKPKEITINHTHDLGAMLLEAQKLAARTIVDITPAKEPERAPLFIEGEFSDV